MKALKPYPFQREALDSVRDRRAVHPDIGRLAVVMATGLGKTVTFSHEALEHVEGDGTRVLILVHTDELARQAVNKLHDCAPGLDVGVVKATTNQVSAQVIVASVATLAHPRRREQITDVGLVIVDECFPAGTLVGGKPIEALQPGDLVPSWDERTGREVMAPVVALMKRTPSSMIRVSLEDGTSFACTPNHPIMTAEGWCPAGMLSHGASVVSFTHDATASEVHGMRDRIRPEIAGQASIGHVPQDGASVLHGHVSGYMGVAEQVRANGQDEPQARIGAHGVQQPDGPPGVPSEDDGHPEIDGTQAAYAGRERYAHAGAAGLAGGPVGLAHGSDRGAVGRREALSLQDRYRTPDHEGLHRGGRGIPLLAGAPRIRPAPGRAAVFTRVAGIQILEPGSDGTYGGVCRDGAVYNVEVAGTHTYLIGDGVLVHNCHHATAPTYQAILEFFGCLDEPVPTPCTGYTATLARGDGVSLAGVWQDVAFVRGISWAIRHRYLIPIRGVAIKVPDLRLSAPTGADFSDQVLGDALAEAFAPDVVAQAYLEHAAGRKGVAFWPTVALAQQSADAFNAAGIKTEVVHGDLPDTERAAILERLESGVITMVSNCMVLGEGWDEPSISLVIIGRPTQSKTLYQQMCGRGPRVDRDLPYDGQDCLIMTVVPMSSAMTLRSLVDLSDKPIIDDGTGTKTLTEMEDEYDLSHQLEPDPVHHYAGPTVAEPFDPLAAASQRIWSRTDGGIKFVRGGKDNLVFLLAVGPGRYRVAWCTIRNVPYRCHLRLHSEDCQPFHDRKGAITDYGGDLETAMGWAEDVAITLGADPLGTYGRKAAPWRANVPDVGMLALATKLGIDVTPYTREGGDRRGNKSGRLSDLIDQRVASRRIDVLIPALLKSLEYTDAR